MLIFDVSDLFAGLDLNIQFHYINIRPNATAPRIVYYIVM